MDNTSLKRQAGLLVMMAVGASAAIFYAVELDVVPTTVALTGERIAVTVVAHAGLDTIVNTFVESAAPFTALFALEMAAGKHRLSVGLQEYSFGMLVRSIGAYNSGPRGDWIFKVNGEFQKESAGSTTLRAGDLVTWEFSAQVPDSL